MNKGKIFPKDVVEHWPEVFGEITLNVVPLVYLDSVTVTFKNNIMYLSLYISLNVQGNHTNINNNVRLILLR